MKLNTRYLKCFFFILMLLESCISYCQDTSIVAFQLDTTLFHLEFNRIISTRSLGPSEFYLNHDPDSMAEDNFSKQGYLIQQQPNSRNYDQYYTLIFSLWELSKLKEAERMALIIMRSRAKYYTSTYYHSSDIPGDTTSNTYGYGSYTSHYKNGAAIVLTKIYIEQKKFDLALKYLELATKKYKAQYSCGTGFLFQKNEYDFYYGRCYEGLARYTQIISLLMPDCLNNCYESLIRTIKKLFTPTQIKKNLLNAEKAMKCRFDKYPSYTYTTSGDSENETEKTDTIAYYAGRAKTRIFGRIIEIPAPYTLKNGEHITRAHFIKELKGSYFYRALAKAAGLPAEATDSLDD